MSIKLLPGGLAIDMKGRSTRRGSGPVLCAAVLSRPCSCHDPFCRYVRSTEKAASPGDRRWKEVMSHCYAALRRELRVSLGREITTTGDGIVTCDWSKPKPSHIGDAAHPELRCFRCDQTFAGAENRAHSFPTRDACGPDCNRKRNSSARDATALRSERKP
jgi:hypothetical protein